METTTTRQELVARLQFVDEDAKNDLLDVTKTNTYLIEALKTFADAYQHDITITSVRTDHGNDGPSPHSHASGDAWDMAVDNWGWALQVLKAMAYDEPRLIYEVGLGGVAKQHDPGNWPSDFDLFQDNDEDHIHVSAEDLIG